MRRLPVVTLLLLAVLLPGAAHAAVAPGAVTFPLDQPVGVHDGVDARGASAGAALPDGGMVVGGLAGGGGVVLVRLRADGSLDSSFGASGRVVVAVPGGRVDLL